MVPLTESPSSSPVISSEMEPGVSAPPVGQEALRGRDEAGDLALHVDGAAPVKDPIADLRGERRRCPRLDVARRDDVGVPGEAEVGSRMPATRVEVLHVGESGLGEGHAVAFETGSGEHALEQRQCAPFDGRHAFAADQSLGKGDGIGCGRHADCGAPASGSGP